jgi:hypothetical protein
MFTSTNSKSKAEATVNQLLGAILPGARAGGSAPVRASSSTQALSHQLAQTTEYVNGKKLRQKRNTAINKKSEQTKKFAKLAKYTVIKQNKLKSTTTPQHEKYLNKLVKKNINLINRVSQIDDEDINLQLQDIKDELIPSVTNKNQKRIRKKKFITAKSDSQAKFNENVRKGYISMPGLTPGLAPVDYNESDDE